MTAGKRWEEDKQISVRQQQWEKMKRKREERRELTRWEKVAE